METIGVQEYGNMSLFVLCFQMQKHWEHFSVCVVFPDAEALLGLATGHELEPLVIQEECDISQPAPSPRRKASELPVFETTTEVDDNLNDVSGVC